MADDMRILVVEDDAKIASFVMKGLKQSGFAVDHAAEGGEGLQQARSGSYDAMVLDLMLPGIDGLSILRKVRQEGIRSPVIILSARASVDDRIKGLQAGGDDYLTKPFAFSELLARIQALIRRASQTAEPFVWQKFRPEFVLVWLLSFYVLLGIVETVRALVVRVFRGSVPQHDSLPPPQPG
jgi:DNA-binding response OmpR family regulator